MKVGTLARGLALITLASHSVAMAKEQKLAFVSCPIVQDTPTVPCWLAEFDGETYYLGIQTDVSADFHPPSLGNKVLVEGEKTSEPRICGGIPLKNMVVSVLPERANNCQTLLMAEERYKLPFDAPRPPGPSTGRLAFSFPEPEKLQPPFQPKSFELHYDFDATVGFKHPRFLVRVMDYAKLVNARSITVEGHRARTKLTDGGEMVERDGLGELRAKEVVDLLRGAGLTSPDYKTSWKNKPETGDASRRRVTITVNP